VTPDTPAPLRTLFRTEVLAHAAVLVEALASPSPGPAEALERAAQQMQAAARIVGSDAAADLARAVEESLSAVRREARSFDRVLGERLSAAVQALQRVAEAAVDPDAPAPDAAALGRLAADLAAQATSPPGPVTETERGRKLAAPADGHAATLLELFREEVRSLSQVLSDGLLTLEEDATDPRRLEPLMRAAHSIKGAARIVDCPPAVALAHAMEELLVAGQAGQVRLGPADIDPLLAGVDMLARLADAHLPTWAAENAAPVADAVAQLDARRTGRPAPAPLAVPPRPAAPLSPPPVAVVAEPADADRVVRISAQSLTRLLGLAGESLVEARWLQPFARSLGRLKKQHDHLAQALADLPAEVAGPARQVLAACREGLAGRIDEFEEHARQSDDLNSRLYREVIASRMRPFADGTHGLARMVRDVARQLGKAVRFEVLGQATDVDRDILDKLETPLGHLLRNALDHGLEPPADRAAAGKPDVAALTLEARHQAGVLNIRVRDDGRGIDLDRLRRKVVERRLTTPDLAGRLSETELLDFLFLPGFSTADSVTDVSGRGVGLDAVQAMAQAVGGAVRVHTRLGRGTTFELQLPITLSVMRAVLVEVAGDPFALPLNRTDRLLRLPPGEVRTLEGKPHFDVDGRHVGLVPARQVFELPAPRPTGDGDLAVVLIGDRSHQYGLVVDGFLGEQDLVVRPLDPRLGRVPNVAAAAVLDDGSPVLILDVDDVIRSAAGLAQDGKLRHQRPVAVAARRVKRVLVVDDSAIVREAERQMLQGRGYEVELAVDGADGLTAVVRGGYDLVVSDIDMPRMTGLEFVRAVRADPRFVSLPVVIVSYKDRPEDKARGLDAGANYYLTKSSFHDGRFLAAVEELIGPPD